jgi:hypothetical protein
VNFGREAPSRVRDLSQALIESAIPNARFRRRSIALLADDAGDQHVFGYARNVDLAEPKVAAILSSPDAKFALCPRPSLLKSNSETPPAPIGSRVVDDVNDEFLTLTTRIESVPLQLGNRGRASSF